jgi:hypothetical protein
MCPIMANHQRVFPRNIADALRVGAEAGAIGLLDGLGGRDVGLGQREEQIAGHVGAGEGTAAPCLGYVNAQVCRQSHQARGPEIRLLDDLILPINHGMAMLTGRKHDRGINLLISMLSRVFDSLWRAREDAVCGYPAESLILCRSVVEHWASARWVELPRPLALGSLGGGRTAD